MAKKNSQKEFFAALVSIVFIVGIVLLVLRISNPSACGVSTALAGQAFSQEIIEEAEEVSLACSDSDSSNDPHTFGYVQVGESKIYDGCDGAATIERFCNGNNVEEKSIACSQRCAHGICDPKS